MSAEHLRHLAADGDMGRAGDDATLGQNMQGYIIPLFLDLLFLISWAMVMVKKGNWNVKDTGWCQCFCLIMCFFQSFYGFLVVHSIQQAWSIVMMLFPLVGFIAFHTGNKKWLGGYVAANLFTYAYSGLSAAQSVWNLGAGSMPDGRNWNTPNTLDDAAYNWDWSDQNHSPCWAYDGHNSFCKWGWARTLYVFSTFNIIAFYFTNFAAFSWYAEPSNQGV